jgi:formyl-CoA transferase
VAGHSEIYLDHPQAAANEMIAFHHHPVMGRMRVAWHYTQFGQTLPTPGKPTPLLGEHTREVLREVGLSEAEITEVYTQGVVKTEEPVIP